MFKRPDSRQATPARDKFEKKINKKSPDLIGIFNIVLDLVRDIRRLGGKVRVLRAAERQSHGTSNFATSPSLSVSNIKFCGSLARYLLNCMHSASRQALIKHQRAAQRRPRRNKRT